MTWKHHFFPEVRKQTRENLGLIISVLAAVFAGWSGWEAHKARVDASELGKQSIQTEQKSVDEQIQAMQLDERPFIRVSGDDGYRETVKLPYASSEGKKFKISFDEQEIYHRNYKISVVGKTPAFHVRVQEDCAATGNKQPKPATEITDISPMLFNESVKRSCTKGPPGRDFIEPQRIAGLVYYEDFFGKTHHVPFCFVYFPRHSDLVEVTECEETNFKYD